MIAYYGSYNGRLAPFLGQAPAAAPPVVPAAPPVAPAAPAGDAGAKPPAAAPAPLISIGGVSLSLWTVLIAGGSILAALAIIAGTAGSMDRG